MNWEREIGCKIRFDDRSSPETYIKLMTEGILLAETQGDPLLSEYNAIIIDEAHERSLNIDFLLGYLKVLLAKRPELKLMLLHVWLIRLIRPCLSVQTLSSAQARLTFPFLNVSAFQLPCFPCPPGVFKSQLARLYWTRFGNRALRD